MTGRRPRRPSVAGVTGAGATGQARGRPHDLDVLRAGEDRLDVPLEPGERWWGGAVADGRRMPFGGAPHARDLGAAAGTDGEGRAGSNQSAPLLLSSTGRLVWSERPFAFSVQDGRLALRGTDLLLGRGGRTLREAYLAASSSFFPPSGRSPARELFTGPQYNSWIQMPWAPTQDGVMAYVRELLDDGMPPGVVMVDDCWSPDYGTWVFDRARFPDPAAMVAQLHAWGCSLMLWVVPFVSPDSAVFRDLESRGLLLRDRSGRTALRQWWNGWSAALDVSDPAAVGWLCEQLDALVAGTGVDGFKFDAGDLVDYRADDLPAGGGEPVDMCEQWARIGLRYPFNEYRACWRMGGQPLAQRLHDKPPSWAEDGLGSLVAELVAQGLLGHAFTCPDMVGGGEVGAMDGGGSVDQEFFVRSAQVAALAPMMQFSLSPSRVLDAVHRAAVADAVRVRQAHVPLLEGLVAHAARTGEPVLRAMAYHHPGLEDVVDQFLLGPDLLVAPVLERGSTERRVQLPPGRWRADDGALHDGPGVITVPAPLDRLPRFQRVVAEVPAP